MPGARRPGGGRLYDVVRERWPGECVFTYWDYRAGMFHQDLGMRIDLVLAATIDRQARKGSGPSDHAPVIVDLDDAPDDDIGPVVPPPSSPAARAGPSSSPNPPERRRAAGRPVSPGAAQAELAVLSYYAPIPPSLDFPGAAALPAAIEMATRALDQLGVGSGSSPGYPLVWLLTEPWAALQPVARGGRGSCAGCPGWAEGRFRCAGAGRCSL